MPKPTQDPIPPRRKSYPKDCNYRIVTLKNMRGYYIQKRFLFVFWDTVYSSDYGIYGPKRFDDVIDAQEYISRLKATIERNKKRTEIISYH